MSNNTSNLQFTLTLDGKQYTGTLQAAEEATRSFTDAATTGSNKASEALRGMTNQTTAAAAAATKAGEAFRKMTPVDKLNAARDILNIRSFHDIQREIDQTSAAYNRLANSGKLTAEELAVANQAQQASILRLKQEMQGIASAMDKAGHAGQVSAGQTAQAWRQLPMQMQDIGVSLAGGMSPLMVLTQQLPQITSSFGGMKETFVALRGALTPMVVGMAAAAATVATLGIAYFQGAAEMHAFERSLIMSGGRVGLTSSQLSGMSARMGEMAGATRGQASEALAMLAGQAGVTAANIERIASTALRLQAVGGPAVEETAKAFASLAKSPLSASIQLNEQTGFLTQSVYKQIRALEAQGRTTEAAKVAQEAYASVMASRIPELEKSLGTLEKAWMSLTTGARKAWDAMLNVGREKTVDDKINEVRAELEANSRRTDRADSVGPSGMRKGADAQREEIQARLEALDEQKRIGQRAASDRASESAQVNAQIANDGAAGDKQRAIASANIDASIAKLKAGADARIRIQERAQADLDALHSIGLVAARDHTTRSLAIETAGLGERRKLLAEQIKLEESRPLKADDFAGAAQQKAKLTGMRSELAGLQEQIAQAPKASASKLLGIDIDDARDATQKLTALLVSASQQAEQYALTNARAASQLISDPLKRARAEAEINALEIEKSVKKAVRELMNGAGEGGVGPELQAKIDALKSAASQSASDTRIAPDLKLVNDLLQKDIGTQMADGFDKASQSMSAVANGLRAMLKTQDEYTQALATQGLTEEKIVRLKAGQSAAQLNSYTVMAGAAKGMFKEHTAGYKVLGAAEKAFRVTEMVGAAQASSAKIALWWSGVTAKAAAVTAEVGAAVAGQGVETGAVVAGEATRNAAKIPGVFLAFMSALGPWGMAAAGAAVAAVLGGAFGGGSASLPVANTGTGTVLGDKNAKSESIKSSLDALKEVDLLALGYSAQMAASLRNIEASISGVSSLLARSGRVQDVTAGIKTGYSGGGIVSKLFGSKTTVLGQGITGTAQALGEILASGSLRAAYYADIEKKSKFFGITTRTKVSTTVQAADPEIERQFGSILSSFANSVRAAAGPLGIATSAVESRLSAFVVDIGKIDLQGLTGEEVSEKLSAVFGAVGDNLARAALSGLEEFQSVGEGYLETVVRVASATESAGEMLRRLGIGAVSLSAIVNKQGDVGAELVRQSIARVETVAGGAASSLGQIISTLSGTAQELADTYSTLADVRGMLRSVGIDGQAVTSDLIRGAGGLSALKEGATTYEEKFLTAAEQTALKTSRMTAAFSRLGLALPKTSAEFRKMVEATNAAAAAGQEQLGGLLALSSTFSEFMDATGAATESVKSAADVASERAGLEDRLLTVQGDTAALRARELAKLDGSNRALQERIWALEDEKKAAEALASAGKGVSAFIDELRGAAGGTASTAKRRAAYQTDLASAQAGDAEASTRIVTSAKALIESVKATATDPLAVARETSRIAAQLQAIPASVAYAAQQAHQAKEAIPVVPEQQVPVSAAQVPRSPVSQTPAGDRGGDMLQELAALRAELAQMRTEQRERADAVVSHTSRTARVLEAVTPDGDSISMRSAR